jgi:dihydrofolate reductase
LAFLYLSAAKKQHMHIILIAAVAENNAIGRGNQLPWHLPDDFKFFKRNTLGHAMLMGRKTMDSLGKPLPGRTSLVVTRSKSVADTNDVKYFSSIENGIEWAQQKQLTQLYIIGGGELFAATMQLADELLITHVHTTIADADAFFPDIDHTIWHRDWQEEHRTDEKHAYAFTFVRYKRVAL